MIKRYGEEFKLTQALLDEIAGYMDDGLREKLHFRLAPCSPEEFLKEYIKGDPEFEVLLQSEFRIEII